MPILAVWSPRSQAQEGAQLFTSRPDRERISSRILGTFTCKSDAVREQTNSMTNHHLSWFFEHFYIKKYNIKIYIFRDWLFILQESDCNSLASNGSSPQPYTATQLLESRRSTPASWRTSLRSGPVCCDGGHEWQELKISFWMVWNSKMMSFKIPFLKCNINKWVLHGITISVYTSLNTWTMKSNPWCCHIS